MDDGHEIRGFTGRALALRLYFMLANGLFLLDAIPFRRERGRWKRQLGLFVIVAVAVTVMSLPTMHAISAATGIKGIRFKGEWEGLAKGSGS